MLKKFTLVLLMISFASGLMQQIAPASATTSEIPHKVASGYFHTCAVGFDGQVTCWGDNQLGQINVPNDLGSVRQIDAGLYHTCAVSELGIIRCWGDNRYLQSSPPSDLGKALEVSAGGDTTCALTVLEQVRCWGRNDVGQTNVPNDLGQVSSISTHNFHSCVVTLSGNARCWGYNDFGETNVPGGLGKITAIATGGFHTCAITVAHIAICWGDNSNGQTSVPADLGQVAELSLGDYTSCAISIAGVVRCWGTSYHGQTTVPKELQNATELESGLYHVCAIESKSRLICWGWNEFGQSDVPKNLRLFPDPIPETSQPIIEGAGIVGSTLTAQIGIWTQDSTFNYQWLRDGVTLEAANSPEYTPTSDDYQHEISVKVTGTLAGYSSVSYTSPGKFVSWPSVSSLGIVPQLSSGWLASCALNFQGKVRCWGDQRSGALVPADLGIVSQISVGALHACALTTDRLVKCWGGMENGQLNVPTDLGPVKQISSGADLTCAILISDRVRCWGVDFYGVLNVPKNLGPVTMISAGWHHVCAIKSSGTVACWGANAEGQTNVPDNLGQVAQISSGNGGTCASTNSGLRCWGANYSGELNVPNGLSKVSQIASGSNHECVLLDTGTVTCWGDGYADETRPPSSITDIVQISGMGQNNCALTSAGSIHCWGENYYGQSDPPTDFNVWPQTFKAAPIPEIIGNPKVGLTLVASSGTWDSGVSYSYRWLRDGQPIVNATSSSYRLVVADYQHKVSAEITGSMDGYLTTTRVSDSVPVTLGELSAIVSGSNCPSATFDTSNWEGISGVQPSIAGNARVSSSLQYRLGLWDKSIKLCRLWVGSGQVISISQTNPNYVPTGQDIGKSVQLFVVGTDRAGKSVFRFSEPVMIKAKRYLGASKPQIAGNLRPGSQLAPKMKIWSTNVDYTYQWFRNGNPIDSAISSRYKLTASDSKTTITLRVCGHKTNYEDLCLTSDPKQVD